MRRWCAIMMESVINKSAYYGITLAAVLGGVDQLSKWLVVHGLALPMNVPHALLPFLDMRLIWNRGVSYGLFAEYENAALFLIIASAAIIAILVVLLWRTTRHLPALGLGLVIGGAMANLVDRLIYGAVVDFISLHAAGFYWYIFNLADVWISIGVVLLLWDGWRHKNET